MSANTQSNEINTKLHCNLDNKIIDEVNDEVDDDDSDDEVDDHDTDDEVNDELSDEDTYEINDEVSDDDTDELSDEDTDDTYNKPKTVININNEEYKSNQKDKEIIDDIVIARKYYWNSMKKDGTTYTDFCELWDSTPFSDKYDIVISFKDEVKSYKSATIKPILNEEDKDYDYDPYLHKIILIHKYYWEQCKNESYHNLTFEDYDNDWDTWSLDDKENIGEGISDDDVLKIQTKHII